MTIKEARRILKGDGTDATDEELQESINVAELLAEIAIETFNKLTPEQRKKYISKSK